MIKQETLVDWSAVGDKLRRGAKDTSAAAKKAGDKVAATAKDAGKKVESAAKHVSP